MYEINTWVWLGELSRKYGRHVTLASVPAAEWDALKPFGFDAVWFMGVWERSPDGIAIATRNPGLLEDFRRALPDFGPDDNVGSPYCVRRYVVDHHLGGPEGLAAARQELTRRGLRLLLDFVPNHVAPDHPWVTSHPEYFIRGTSDDARHDPGSFLEVHGEVFACGRDPFFPAWPDVLQLNAFHEGLRQAAVATLQDIGAQCDGVRCDMAMLLTNPVFARTWGVRAGPIPESEYWIEVIAATKKTHPDFLFVAEAYWDLEWELQQQGFDYCYDKRLYDRLEHDGADGILLHLCADLSFQGKLVRFVENHDEIRARTAFSPLREKAAAVVVATLPGAKLFHEGQFEGRKTRVPVFLGRRPVETVDSNLQAFYQTLLTVPSLRGLREGTWQLCDRMGWPDNISYQNLVAWCWRRGSERQLIVVNLSYVAAQGRICIPWDDLPGRHWQMTDTFTGQVYQRRGDELVNPGLYVDLSPWGFHVMIDWTPGS
jgi:hypothetical protein